MNKFIEALQAYIEKKIERDKAFADCDHSWGYYGHNLEEELENALKEVEKTFRDAVLGIVKEVATECKKVAEARK